MNEQTNPAGGVAQPSIEERLANLLNPAPAAAKEEPAPTAQAEPLAPPAAEQADATEDQAPSDELTADDLTEDEPQADAGQSAAAQEFEIVHDGQQHKLTRAETIELAQKGFDYTRKTQAVAQAQAQVTEALQTAQQVMQMQVALGTELAQIEALNTSLKPYQNVDWVALAQQDPSAYAQHRANYDQLRDGLTRAQQGLQAKAVTIQEGNVRATQALLQAEMAKLPEFRPAWRDPTVYAADAKAIAEYGVKEGYTAEEMNTIRDARIVKTLWKAKEFDRLMSQKVERLKQVRTAPPMAKPAAAETPQTAAQQQVQKLRQRARKSGDWRDAAAVLAKMK